MNTKDRAVICYGLELLIRDPGNWDFFEVSSSEFKLRPEDRVLTMDYLRELRARFDDPKAKTPPAKPTLPVPDGVCPGNRKIAIGVERNNGSIIVSVEGKTHRRELNWELGRLVLSLFTSKLPRRFQIFVSLDRPRCRHVMLKLNKRTLYEVVTENEDTAYITLTAKERFALGLGELDSSPFGSRCEARPVEFYIYLVAHDNKIVEKS